MNDHLTLMEFEKNASNCKVYVHSLDEGCGVWNKMYSDELFSPPDFQCKNWCLSHRVLSMVVRLYFKRADCFSAMITELIQKHILSGVSVVQGIHQEWLFANYVTCPEATTLYQLMHVLKYIYRKLVIQ